jgi:hypothetical protein
MPGLCSYATVCPVYRGDLEDMPVLARQYRARYCVADWQACARFAVADEAGSSVVPDTLLPNQHERGYEIVSRQWCKRGRSPAATVFGDG